MSGAGWPNPWAEITDAQYDEAWQIGERLTERLVADGWICGHPDLGDVATVIRVLHHSGLLRPTPGLSSETTT